MPVAPRITLLSRVALSPETVFALLTEPRHVQSWWAGAGGKVAAIQMEPRANGTFWVAVLLNDGRGFDNYGRFVEVTRGEVLVADWEHGGPVSRLVIQLLKLGERTEITLTHRDFPDEESRDFQLERWTDALAAFERYAARIAAAEA